MLRRAPAGWVRHLEVFPTLKEKGRINHGKTKAGSAGPEVPVICLGGNVYGWTLPETDVFRQLDAALDAGLNFVDTADVYSRWVPGNKGGESETMIGKWFAKTGKRSDVIVATKVGMEMGEGKKGLKAAYIRQAVEDSLNHHPRPGDGGRARDDPRSSGGSHLPRRHQAGDRPPPRALRGPAMIPGEIIPAAGEIELNAGRPPSRSPSPTPATGRSRWAATITFSRPMTPCSSTAPRRVAFASTSPPAPPCVSSPGRSAR